jgi:hypothetical protein
MHATIGAIEKMPRFWVLTDHARRQVVLVFRGTMSLNELAVVSSWTISAVSCDIDENLVPNRISPAKPWTSSHTSQNASDARALLLYVPLS